MEKLNILKKMKIKINASLLFDVFLLIYLILNQLNYIFAFKGILQLFTILTMSGIGLLMFTVVLIRKKDLRIILFVLTMFFFGGISYIFIRNVSILVYLTMIRYIGIAAYLVYYKQNKKVMRIMMIITLILFSPVFFQNLGFNLLGKASRNSYSILLFIANFIFNKAYWDRKEKAPIFPTITALFICIFSGGRSGIITYSLFTIGVLINNYVILKNNFFKIKEEDEIRTSLSLEDTKEIPIITDEMLEKYKEQGKLQKFFSVLSVYKREVFKTIVIISIFSLIFGLKYIDNKYKKISLIKIKLEDNVTDPAYGFQEKGLTSNTRVRLIERYTSYMFSDVNEFFNGVQLKKDPLFEKYAYNLHNSYLLLHSKFGIYGVLLCGYLCLRALINLFRGKHWGDALIYLSILARIFMDNAAFPRHLDIVIFYFVFAYYSFPNKEKQIKEKEGEKETIEKKVKGKKEKIKEKESKDKKIKKDKKK